jgi:hypothetical protein
MWYRSLLVFTHDGGKTWQFWNPKMVESLLSTLWVSEDSRIEGVEFFNNREGEMLLQHYDSGRPEPELHLYTSDGGASWLVRESN